LLGACAVAGDIPSATRDSIANAQPADRKSADSVFM
jgi:hypothetical protein